MCTGVVDYRPFMGSLFVTYTLTITHKPNLHTDQEILLLGCFLRLYYVSVFSSWFLASL